MHIYILLGRYRMVNHKSGVIRKFKSLFKKNMKGETQMIQKLTDMPSRTIHPSSGGQNIGKRNVHKQKIFLCYYHLHFKRSVIFVIHMTMHMTLKRSFSYNVLTKYYYFTYCFYLVYCENKNRKP